MNKVWKMYSWVKRTLSKTADTHRCFLILFLGVSPQLQFNLAVHVGRFMKRVTKNWSLALLHFEACENIP